jgi:hypothetical protein
MKRFFAATACLIFLGLLVHSAAFAQHATTGDRKLDSLLGRINLQERSDPDGFLLHLSRSYNVPEAEIRLAKTRYELNAGDTYMSTILSRIFNRSVGDVAEEYSKNRGQGWGVMAMNKGIKPGSPEFHRMKADARGSVSHLKTLAKANTIRKNQQMKKDRENARKTTDASQGKGQGKGKKK